MNSSTATSSNSAGEVPSLCMLNNQHGHSAGQKEGSMKSRTMTCITAMTLFAALAIAVRLRLAAQEAPAAQGQATAHTRYKLIDIGTFGGAIELHRTLK